MISFSWTALILLCFFLFRENSHFLIFLYIFLDNTYFIVFSFTWTALISHSYASGKQIRIPQVQEDTIFVRITYT